MRPTTHPMAGEAQLDTIGANPRYSIVVPCFNEAAYLPATLRSLKNQTFTGSYEIVVVDNNSTDATADVARAFGVRVVNEPITGVCWARQRGTTASRGDIVVSADADTTYPPGWLATLDATFRSDAGIDDEGIVAVVGPCRYVGGPAWGRGYARLLFGAVQAVYASTGRTAYASATNIAFRRCAFPGYDVRLTQGGDELNVLRDLRRRGRVVYAHTNPTLTSSRRLTRGAVYGFFVTLLVYYLLAYHLNRALGRTVIGSAPAFRDDRTALARRLRTSSIVVVGLALAVVAVRVS
jgi:glycosyltransferase involved in cell wall biosynthesis